MGGVQDLYKICGLFLFGFSSTLHALDLRKVESDYWTDRYDPYFRKQAKHYFGPLVDWHWFKAQGIAESDLRPDVESHKKAYGIMQLMPSTFEEIRLKGSGFGRAQIEDPRWNIAAGIYYDGYLFLTFSPIDDVSERFNYTFGAYNAGRSRILERVRRVGGEEERWPLWSNLNATLPTETSRYVERIHKLME